MAGMGLGLRGFGNHMEGMTPASHSSRFTEALGLGPVHEHSLGPLETAQLGFHLLIKASQTRPWPIPGDGWGWESGRDRADRREAWRCGEGKQVPGSLLLPASCRVPSLGSAVTPEFESHLCHFLAGDLGQIRFHL